MNPLIDKLSDAQVMKALRLIANQWWTRRGLEALTVYEYARQKREGEVAEVLAGKLELAPPVKRLLLSTLVEGEDEEVRRWATRSVEEVRKPEGQALDPFLGGSLLILSSCFGLSVLLLAGRVKKVGGTEFEKGIPRGLLDLAKIAVHAPIEAIKKFGSKFMA